jgi:uncharacterized repeat protein (TIGR04076 family)
VLQITSITHWEGMMADQKKPHVGYKVEGEILSVKGTCSWGHKAGDKFELSGYDCAGLCGFFYHDIFPYVVMLQFGGGFPPGWGGPNVVELECMDRSNLAKIRLKRM